MGDRSHSAGGIGRLMGRHDDKTGYETGYEMTFCDSTCSKHEAFRSYFLFNV
jgi:hypothetical protein